MTTILIQRGEPFKRGDMMIQIRVDGKKAGTLIGDKPLRITVPPGIHLLRASMSGLPGQKLELEVSEDTELPVAVWGTRIAEENVWLQVASAVLFALPIQPLWLRALLTISVCAIALYVGLKTQKSMLRLSVNETKPEGSEAII